MKYLHFVDAPFKFGVRNGFEDLPERLEVASIQDILTGTCAAPQGAVAGSSVPGLGKDQLDLPPSQLNIAPFSFSLTGEQGTLADQVATDASRFADWTDGLNMLRKDGGYPATDETAGFVHALTEIGLKIRLLGMESARSSMRPWKADYDFRSDR
jgi:engulfment and cell motility protein 1